MNQVNARARRRGVSRGLGVGGDARSLTPKCSAILISCMRWRKSTKDMRHTSRPHHLLKAVCGVLGYPTGAAAELLDGTLKLRYCTTVFPNRFFSWVLLTSGSGVGKRYAVTSDILLDCKSNFGKQVWLTRKRRPGIPVHDVRDPGHPTARRWKRLHPPDSSGAGRKVGEPRNLFPRLEVG